MFEKVEPAPPDPILGLTETFRDDPRPEKINLTVGVYKDDQGRTPILDVVREAEVRLAETVTSKAYAPISGEPAYVAAVQDLLLADGAALAAARAEDRAVTVDTAGGTGALRVAGELVRSTAPDTTVWLSDPTWENHTAVFRASGLATSTYPYLDRSTGRLAFAAMYEAFEKLGQGDVVLLHGCCHNPTGVDPTSDQWEHIAALLGDQGIVPLVDFAYQGLGRGLAEDAESLVVLARHCPEMIISSSFSKNFGLYNERVGALTLVCRDAGTAGAALSRVKAIIRTLWSNPPTHGAEIVATVLTDPTLRARWEDEVAAMRDRIRSMRRLFVDTLAAKGVTRDLDYLVAQNGIFGFSGLGADDARRLRDAFAVYVLDSGRINVAGMTPDNMDRLTDAVAAVWVS
ncbi:MAG: aspartate/tyrosine/aromatic aminotransferase [Acidimicrobiia bacterium]|nr:aspartate/tyrosine/aromatic aminotransferase [Acidimicrobiia bacterium]